MPIFEYKCTDCGFVSEFLEKNRTQQRHTCPKCGSSSLQKLLSGFAVGQSKSASRACESCIGGASPTGPCPGGTCPRI